MSSDGHASIGYGFRVPAAVADESKVDLEDLLDDDALDYTWAGDAFGDNFETFLIIEESLVGVYTWEGGSKKFDPSKLKVKNDWDKKLTDWAKRHKVSKPKIGWHLCVSI